MFVGYMCLGTYRYYPQISISLRVIGFLRGVILFGSVSLLTACSSFPLKMLTGGGPNLAANVQAGQTNSQTVGTTRITDQRTDNGDVNSIESEVFVEEGGKVTVNQVQPWMILLLVLGWLLPSPGEIARWITNLFKRNKNG
jgi:hypothetical protein